MALDHKYSETEKLEKAKKKIKDIRGFYGHLTVYLIINLLIVLVLFDIKEMIRGYQTTGDFRTWFTLNTFSTPFLWGIGLLIHWFCVFGPKFKFGILKRWEQRKIKEFLEKEEDSSFKKY